MHLPNGSKVYMSGDLVLATRTQTIRASRGACQMVVNGNHGLLLSDYFMLPDSPVESLRSVIFKVRRISGADGNTIDCLCTNFTLDTGWDFKPIVTDLRKVANWLEFPCIMNISGEGGGQRYYNYQCMNKKTESRIKTYRDLMSVEYTVSHDYLNPFNGHAQRASDSGEYKIYKMEIPRARESRVYLGKMEFIPSPTTTVNEMETISFVVTMQGDYTFLPTNNGPILVEQIDYSTGMKLIAGSVPNSRDSYYEMAKNQQNYIASTGDRVKPEFATEKGVSWVAIQGGEYMRVYADPAYPTQSVGLEPRTSAISKNENVIMQATANDGGGATSWPVRILIRNEIATLSYTLEYAPRSTTVYPEYVDVNDIGSVVWTQTPANSPEGRVWTIDPPNMGNFNNGFIPSGILGNAEVVLRGARWLAEIRLPFRVVNKVASAAYTSPPNDTNLVRTSLASDMTLNVNPTNANATLKTFRYEALSNLTIVSVTGNSAKVKPTTTGKGTFKVISTDGYYVGEKNIYSSNATEIRVASLPGFPNVPATWQPIENTIYPQTVSGGVESVNTVINLGPCNIERFYILQGGAPLPGGINITFPANANTHYSVDKVINNVTNPAQLNKPLMFFKHPSSGKWDMALMTV